MASAAHARVPAQMTRSILVDQKKRGRGRPATGRDPVVSGRVPKEVLDALDQWAAANGCTRSEAVAHLLARGLSAAKVDAQVAANRAARRKPGEPKRRG